MSESYVAGSGYDEYLRANSLLLEANPRSDLLYFETIQHGGGNCLSGITSALGMVGGNLTSKLGSTAQYANTLKTGGGLSMAGGAMFWGGMACSVASGLLGVIGDALAEPVTYEYIPGKIDMKLDAQLDLSGTISSYSSTDQSIYNVTLANIDATNGKDGHFGRGIWSLAEDPVIYLDRDDLLSDYDHFTIMDDPVGSGRYSNSDFGNYGTRYVYFLDPTSVKVNINTDLFPDVEKVYLTTTCGIYPSRETDNDSAYRSFLNLPVDRREREIPGNPLFQPGRGRKHRGSDGVR